MFQFVQDRAPQGAFNGPFRSTCDQTRYRSIWGVVEGPMTGPWTGSMIENGEVYSADGKARIGGTPVLDKKGRPNFAKDGQTTFQEFQVPVESVEKWNQYEAKQGNEQVKAFQEREHQKAASLGRAPVLEIDHIEVEATDLQHTPTIPMSEPASRKTRSPEHLAAMKAGRERAKAAKQQAAAA